jgi:hypothetical protein
MKWSSRKIIPCPLPLWSSPVQTVEERSREASGRNLARRDEEIPGVLTTKKWCTICLQVTCSCTSYCSYIVFTIRLHLQDKPLMGYNINSSSCFGHFRSHPSLLYDVVNSHTHTLLHTKAGTQNVESARAIVASLRQTCSLLRGACTLHSAMCGTLNYYACDFLLTPLVLFSGAPRRRRI